MRKLSLPFLIFISVTMLTLAACGDSPVAQNVATDTEERPGSIWATMRGEWNNSVYNNELLGISFALPPGWSAHTDAEIATIMDIGASTIEDVEFADESDWFTDMMVSCPSTGANVQIMFVRLPYYVTSIDEYIEMEAVGLELVGGIIDLSFTGTTRIGAYEWRSFDAMFDFGRMMYGRQFITLQDGIARSILISYFDDSETLEEIMSMFEN